MQCTECTASGAQPAQVIFSEEKATELYLCEECFSKFEASKFVVDVTLLESATDSEDVVAGNSPPDEP